MSIDSIRRKQDFLANDAPAWAKTVWPRIESLNHFIKTNRAQLQAAGAIVLIGREWFVLADTFPTAAGQVLGLPLEDTEGGSHD